MDERTGPLTWGQYLPWVTEHAAPEQDNYFKILSFDVNLAVGVPAGTALDLLDEIVAKNEGLRTTFEPADDSIRQVVHPPGRGYRWQISDAEPAGQAPDGSAEWLGAPFDLAREWPLRAYAWCRADGSWQLRLAVHRMILDNEGAGFIVSFFERAVEVGAAEAEKELFGSGGWGPVDIANFEQSETGQRRDRRAYEYWRRTLVTAPACLFATSRPQRPTDSRFVIMLARANLRGIVRDLAARYHVTEPTVLAAASLLILSWLGGSPRVCATVVSNNRSHREMRTSLSPMLDRSLLNVAVDPEQTFSAWAGTVRAATLASFRHSHADPNSLLRAYADVSMERGLALDRLPILNVMADVATATPRIGQAPVVPESAMPPRPPDEYDVKVIQSPLDGMFLRTRSMRRRIMVELIAGEQMFDQATAEYLVLLFPAVLEALSVDDDPTLEALADNAFVNRPPVRDGVPAAPAVVDHTRVDLAATNALLRECAGVADCATFARTHEGSVRLQAFVVGTGTDVTAQRRAVLGRLPKYRHVLCPQWFTVVAEAPAVVDSAEAWEAMPVLAEGSGWPASPYSPQPPTPLAEAVAAANPGLDVAAVDLGLPYCLAGGRFERIPELLREFSSRGIEGISVDDLMGTQPLMSLVDRSSQG